MHDTLWPRASTSKASQRSRHCGIEELVVGMCLACWGDVIGSA